MRIIFRGKLIRNLVNAVTRIYRLFIFVLMVLFGIVEDLWAMVLVLLGIDWFRIRKRIENKIRIFIS